MTAREPAVRDDRILGFNPRLSLVIIPFLLVAFVLLYLFPGTRGASSPGPSSRP